jgi:ElaB/YqjD/DUF883 family membrane-anchored ribosome-binding protein
MPDTNAEALRRGASDTLEQIRELREQVETLLRDRVPPILNDAAERATGAARQATNFVKDEADMVAGKVRDRPITWIAGALLAGFVVGRMSR